jgi:hypothetical protein
MIIENEPSLTRFVLVPRELSQLNCGAFCAGILEAVLTAAGYVRAPAAGRPFLPVCA